MGWWRSADGTGVIGDRPADILGDVLLESFGERIDSDLFGGFLAAVAAGLLRNPTELVADPPGAGDAIVVSFEGGRTLVIPFAPAVVGGRLDDAVYDALEGVAFNYRDLGPERPPRLAELLETIAFTSRRHVVPALRSLTVQRAGDPSADAEQPAAAWAAMRSLLAGASVPDFVVAGALADPDWRARMTALLVVGRLRLRSLVREARRAAIPPLEAGLRDVDRRALLALRDCAAAIAAGERVDRPIHPDPAVAAARADLIARVQAAIEDVALPEPSEPACVLRALIAPDEVRSWPDLPTRWRAWLSS